MPPSTVHTAIRGVHARARPGRAKLGVGRLVLPLLRRVPGPSLLTHGTGSEKGSEATSGASSNNLLIDHDPAPDANDATRHGNLRRRLPCLRGGFPGKGAESLGDPTAGVALGHLPESLLPTQPEAGVRLLGSSSSRLEPHIDIELGSYLSLLLIHHFCSSSVLAT